MLQSRAVRLSLVNRQLSTERLHVPMHARQTMAAGHQSVHHEARPAVLDRGAMSSCVVFDVSKGISKVGGDVTAVGR